MKRCNEHSASALHVRLPLSLYIYIYIYIYVLSQDLALEERRLRHAEVRREVFGAERTVELVVPSAVEPPKNRKAKAVS